MKKLYLILATMAIMSVSACGATKKALGFAKEGPDETNVQTNQPLVLPPEYSVRPDKNAKPADETEDYTLEANE